MIEQKFINALLKGELKKIIICLTCPHCNGRVEVVHTTRGHKIRCPACGLTADILGDIEINVPIVIN